MNDQSQNVQSQSVSDELLEKMKTEIVKSMPQQVGEELQKLLKQAKEDAYYRELYQKQAIKNADEISELEAKLRKFGDLEQRENKLADDFKVLEQRERNLQIEILKIKLEESEKRGDMVKEFTAGLVRNTQFRTDVFGSNTEITRDQYGSLQTQAKPYNYHETKSEQ